MRVTRKFLLAWIPVLCCLVLTDCAHPLNWPSSPKSGIYTVRPGDTLYSIAWRYGLDYRALAAWNHIAPPYVIYAGERLRLAGGAFPAHSEPGHETVASSVEPLARHRYTGPWKWPAGGHLVGHFTGHGVNGSGIDILGKPGETVRAAHAGRVVYAGSGLPDYGRLIIIRNGPEYLSAYAFNQQIKVAEGAIVKAGQPIAAMGERDGRPLLHFEIRKDGHPINPLLLLPRR